MCPEEPKDPAVPEEAADKATTAGEDANGLYPIGDEDRQKLLDDSKKTQGNSAAAEKAAGENPEKAHEKSQEEAPEKEKTNGNGGDAPGAFIVGGEDRQILLDGMEENHNIMLSMLQQAKREVQLCSLLLDPQLLNNNEAIDAFRAAIVNNKNFRLQALVYDPALLAKTGHRLLEFGRSKPSFCSFRVPSKHHASFDQALCIVDDTAFIHRPKSEYWRGVANYNDVPKAQRYKELFNTIWNSGEPDQELRQFRI